MFSFFCYGAFMTTANTPSAPPPTRKPLIVVVDDEIDILELISIQLGKAGFAVKTFEKAAPLKSYLDRHTVDLLVLDLMLPDADGLELCKELKQSEPYRSLPILMLTARGDEVDVVLGLEFGADDYMVKPFSPKELTARIRAVLRRSGTAAMEKGSVLQIGALLEIDLRRYTVRVAGEGVPLTSTEFGILTQLARKPGWVFSREQLLKALWGDEKDVLDRTIDVHIKHLREKLGPAGAYIKNIRGVGYKIEP